jgi:hypothetical protein
MSSILGNLLQLLAKSICFQNTAVPQSVKTALKSLISYFSTLLYGIYPCNFVKFTRSPFNYLNQRMGSDDQFDWLDEDVMRNEIEELMKDFIVHPLLFRETAESELRGRAIERWRTPEAEDVVAEWVPL